MTISFDYDQTLSRPEIQDLAKYLKAHGHRILIITNRESRGKNSDLKSVAESIGVKDHHIWFCEMMGKDRFIRPGMQIDLHIDDDFIERDLIEEYCEVKCMDSNDPSLVTKVLEFVSK